MDYVVSSSKLAEVESPAISLRLQRDDSSSHAFEVSADQFAVLYSGACACPPVCVCLRVPT